MIYTNISQPLKDNKPIFFQFWANCILVKGHHRGVIFDIFRRRQIVVSHLFYELFDQYKYESIANIKTNPSFGERRGYLKILDFFVKNDFGIYIDNPAELPPLSMEYDSPYMATTMVFKSDSDANCDFMLDTIRKIAQYPVLSLQINDEGHMSLNTMRAIGEITTQSTIECLHIYTHYLKSYNLSDFTFMIKNLRFRQVIFMQAPMDKQLKPINGAQGTVLFKKDIVDFNDCGNIGRNYFVFNQTFFIEGHSCNTCLNRKISIDKDGNIGNCPLMPHSFGNIKNTSLKDIVSRQDFQRLWNITKDQVEVCKDCEYRYLCTDCRHFIKDRKNIYSQPAKCGYNPYIAKWSDEEGYVPLEESVINHR